MHGMNGEQTELVKKLSTSLKATPFTVGMACDKAGVHEEHCLEIFPQLCDLGVLRCPVNDGGMKLYEIALEVVENIS